MSRTFPAHTADVPAENAADTEILLDRLDTARSAGVAIEIRAAEHALICRFHGFAGACACRFMGRGVDVEDLRQIAEVGLVKAVRGWRPQPTGGFLQYAKPMVMGELRRYFRDTVPLIRIPRHLQEAGIALAMARRDLSSLGREPTNREIAEATGLSIGDVRADAVARATNEVESLETSTAPWVPDATAVPDATDAMEIRIQLREAIGTLNGRERRILAMRFFDDRTQEQIGEVLGVSQMQVSRLLRATLNKLREQLDSTLSEPAA